MAKQLLIKDGKLQTNASGELLIIPDGDSASNCACCVGCTLDGYNCAHCDDDGGSSPSQYTVTFDSVSLCEGCMDFFGRDIGIGWAAGGDILNNTPITLTQTGNGTALERCTWEATFSEAMDDMGGDDCDEPYEGGELDLWIVLTRNSTTWMLQVIPLFTSFGFAHSVMFEHEATESGVGVCATVPAFTNILDTCGNTDNTVPTRYDSATGGTATVVCV